jgi:SAM-dependent methyltransferase
MIRKISGLLRSINASIAKRGVVKTISLIKSELLKEKNIKPDDEFDIMYNVETAVIVQAGELETKSKNWKYTSAYKPIYSSFSLSKLLLSFRIDLSEYIFIDLGSGKGRAILMASMLPFKEIIGVEFSEILNDIAKSNVEKFPKNLQLCKNISFITIDATEYIFPDEKYILYMFNPFDKIIMEKVLENISKQFYARPVHIIVIYINPQFAYLLEALDFMRQKESDYEISHYLCEVKPEFL